MLRRSFVLAASAAVAIACGSGASETGHWEGSPSADSKVDRGGAGAWPGGAASAGENGGAREAGAPTTNGDAATSTAFACSGKTAVAGEKTLTLRVGTLDRTMIVHVPPKYDPKLGASLVFNFHGFTMNGSQERDMSRMNATSDAHGFVVVYPDGTGASWNAGDCCGSAVSGNVDDIGMVRAAIAKISADWCVDPKRIYATGFSNGGFFSHRLACEMSDTIAAIAPVSGVMGKDPAGCKPSRPISVLEFHGTSDIVVPFNGGVPISPIDFGGPITFRGVTETVDFWRTQNDCLGGKKVYATGDATCTRYNCKAGTNVEFCIIDGGGHTWPGGPASAISPAGKTSMDIDASEQIADFFEAHPLP